MCVVPLLWRAVEGLRWWAEHALATILQALTGRALERPHSTPAALRVIPCVRQHNDHRPCRCCPHTGPLPVKRAAAPPVEPRSRQPELASLPHCCRASPVGNGARLKREPWFRQKAFHLHFFTFFSREQQRDRLRTRARSEARAPPGCGPVPTPMVHF